MTFNADIFKYKACMNDSSHWIPKYTEKESFFPFLIKSSSTPIISTINLLIKTYISLGWIVSKLFDIIIISITLRISNSLLSELPSLHVSMLSLYTQGCHSHSCLLVRQQGGKECCSWDGQWVGEEILLLSLFGSDGCGLDMGLCAPFFLTALPWPCPLQKDRRTTVTIWTLPAIHTLTSSLSCSSSAWLSSPLGSTVVLCYLPICYIWIIYCQPSEVTRREANISFYTQVHPSTRRHLSDTVFPFSRETKWRQGRIRSYTLSFLYAFFSKLFLILLPFISHNIKNINMF